MVVKNCKPKVWRGISCESLCTHKTCKMKNVLEEAEHLSKTGIPRCLVCKKDFINDVDSITGKKSKRLWKPDCEHNKDLRLSKG